MRNCTQCTRNIVGQPIVNYNIKLVFCENVIILNIENRKKRIIIIITDYIIVFLVCLCKCVAQQSPLTVNKIVQSSFMLCEI